MNALVTMTTDQALVFGFALITIGFLSSQWLTRWADEHDEPIVEDLAAAQDVAIAHTIEPEPTLVIPIQRVTNGEDLLGGDPR